jgi:hypothetical protein
MRHSPIRLSCNSADAKVAIGMWKVAPKELETSVRPAQGAAAGISVQCFLKEVIITAPADEHRLANAICGRAVSQRSRQTDDRYLICLGWRRRTG